MTDSEAPGGCWLEVANDYPWIGDPRLGRFKVYLDGQAVGVAPVAGSLRVTTNAGHHTVRVRFRWYGSPPAEFDAAPGQTVRFGADILRELPLLKRMLRMAFRPARSLSIAAVGSSAEDGVT